MRPTDDAAPRSDSTGLSPDDENRRFDEVVGAVMHDTRSIAIAAEGLVFRAAARSSDPRVKAYLAAVQESMVRLSEMATSTFDLLRWRDQKLSDVAVSAVDLAEIAQAVCAIMTDDFAEHNVTLHLATERAVVRGDRTGLYRVVLNLLSNARRHARQSSGSLQVHVSVRSTPQGATLLVEDSGPGYPTMVLQRSSLAYPSWHRGSGLGLAIVSQIVTVHGGSITLSNRAAGGARAFISLPPLHENPT